jgi:hypothetical protein
MKDVKSIVFQFLIMARDAARSKSGEIQTGLPRYFLDRVSTMTIGELAVVAENSPTSIFSLRLSEGEMNRLFAIAEEKRPAYQVSVIAGNKR